jgi:hypothetical protein
LTDLKTSLAKHRRPWMNRPPRCWRTMQGLGLSRQQPVGYVQKPTSLWQIEKRIARDTTTWKIQAELSLFEGRPFVGKSMKGRHSNVEILLVVFHVRYLLQIAIHSYRINLHWYRTFKF